LLGRLRMLSQLAEHLGETLAPNHFHAEKQPLQMVGAQFVDGDDVRVFELASDLCFLDEAELLGGISLVQEVLDGDFAANVTIHSPEDGAHAASGDLPLNEVAAVFRDSLGK